MNKTLLVVDDEPMTRDLLRLMLETAGFHVLEAANGKEAFTKATETPPDLIILDLMMPEINGVELCRRLRAAEATAELPIIVLTAKPEAIAKNDSLRAGADKFINKPVSRNFLVTQIVKLLTSPAHAIPTVAAVAWPFTRPVGRKG